ncbi:MAG: hypothetical protein AAFY05_17660, partial [Pseudomonadota bacterium]
VFLAGSFSFQCFDVETLIYYCTGQLKTQIISASFSLIRVITEVDSICISSLKIIIAKFVGMQSKVM